MPRTSIPAALLAAPLFLLAAPLPGHAADLLFLKNSPAAKFTQADFKLMRGTADKALSGPADGPAQSWSNDKTGASGTITPEGTEADKSGRECRRLRIANTYKLNKDEGVYTFCRAKSSGQWQLRP